jgi:cell division protein FtsA
LIGVERGTGKRLHLWRGTAHRTQGAVVGIDAGNVDVRVVIATMDAERAPAAPDDAVPVLGAGVVPAQGLSRGVVTDSRRLGEAIRTAVAQAERAAGHRVLGAYFSVPLSQFGAGARGERPGRMVLTSPIAVREVSLHAAERAVIWHEVARHAGLEVVGIVPSALAASAAVVLPEEHEQGAIVVECGAEHTSVAVFSGGTVQLLGTVPVGGDHITRDLASVLGIDPLEAERLKHEIGNARTGMPGVEVLVRGPGGQRTAVSVALIAAIVSARVDQMLGHVGEMVKPVASVANGGRGREMRIGGLEQVILCGGGAALSGLAPRARAALGMPVRIAGAWGFAGPAAVQSPTYAPVLGLLRWRAMVQPQGSQREPSAVRLAHGTSFGTPNLPEFAGQPNRIAQTRWQAWLREFLP